MTDSELIKALENSINTYNEKGVYVDTENLQQQVFDLINRQKAEIERLKSELSNTRRKALLEASSKFAGHSNYHGDTILEKLTCMAEGQEVGKARPLDMSDLRELVGDNK